MDAEDFFFRLIFRDDSGWIFLGLERLQPIIVSGWQGLFVQPISGNPTSKTLTSDTRSITR